MLFFQPKPNLGDQEKARLEFHWQEIAESIGFQRCRLGVLPMQKLRELSRDTPQQIVAFACEHLSHHGAGLQVQVAVQRQDKCGGGG